MLKQQDGACSEVLHSTEPTGDADIGPPVFSADRSLLPLAQWTESELDFFFDGLMVLVLHEGEAH